MKIIHKDYTLILGEFSYKDDNASDDSTEFVRYVGSNIKFESETCIFIGFEELTEYEKSGICKAMTDFGIKNEMYKQFVLAQISDQRELEQVFKNWSYYAGGGGLFILGTGIGSIYQLFDSVLNYSKSNKVNPDFRLVCQDISDGDMNAFKLQIYDNET